MGLGASGSRCLGTPASAAVPFGVASAIGPSALNNVRVGYIERMAAKAVCLGKIASLDRLTAKGILLDAHDFKVGGINTRTIPA